VLGGEPLRVAVGGARTLRLFDARSGEMIQIR
jgi:hypothetical protein